MHDCRDVISADPGVCHGNPCINGIADHGACRSRQRCRQGHTLRISGELSVPDMWGGRKQLWHMPLIWAVNVISGWDDMRVEEEYFDVLQNIKAAVVTVYDRESNLLDLDALDALEALIRSYTLEERGIARARVQASRNILNVWLTKYDLRARVPCSGRARPVRLMRGSRR